MPDCNNVPSCFGTSHLYSSLICMYVSSARSFAKPPKAVQTVCECIVVMRGIREVSWKSAKGMMSEANFLKSLTEMDVDNINQKQTQAVKGRCSVIVTFYLLPGLDGLV